MNRAFRWQYYFFFLGRWNEAPLAVVAAALFVVGVACWLATSGRLRPRDSPPVVREGKPIVGNLLGFALGKRGPLDFIERNYHRYGGARPRE